MSTHSVNFSEPDPEWDELLRKPDVSEELKLPRGLEEQRKAFKEFSKLKADRAPIPEGVEIQTFSIPSYDGAPIPIRTYVPSNTGSLNPAIFVIHGGGFIVGSLDAEELNCRRFAAELGFSVVNVEHRLAPEHSFPVGLNDSYEALKWTAENAERLHADFTKGFIAFGISAGANFAAVLAIRARDDPSFMAKLTGQVLQIPYLCDPDFYPDKYKHKLLALEENGYLTPGKINKDSVFRLRKIYNAPEGSPDFSPLLATSHAGLPPAFIQVAGRDVLRDDGIVYAEVLQEAGVPARLEVYPGVPHGFHVDWPQLKLSIKWHEDLGSGLRWLLDLQKTHSEGKSA